MSRSRHLSPSTDAALQVDFILPIGFDGGHLGVVWIPPTGRPDLAQLQQRLNQIGEQADCLPWDCLHSAFGRTFTRWIPMKETYPDALFLHVTLDAPPIFCPSLHLPPLQAECLIRLDMRRKETAHLFQSLTKSWSSFFRFEVVPAWVAQLPHLQLDTHGWNMSTQAERVLASSLPVPFHAVGIAHVKRQFVAWQQSRGEQETLSERGERAD